MKYALVNGILLDGTEAMQPRPGLTVLLNGDRIEAIVPAGTEPPDYEKIDLSGGYVMPGLINLHVHLPASGKPTVKQKDPKKALRHVDLVIARGKVYRSPKVKKIEKAERERDKFL